MINIIAGTIMAVLIGVLLVAARFGIFREDE
jgi:hypothetical protein